MIVIAASALLALYIFLPEFLFRKLAFNFRLVTKAPTGRFEEIISGAEVVLLPFLSSLFLSRCSHFVGHWPFSIEESVAAKYSDYRAVITSLCSEAYFRDHLDKAWTAMSHVWLYQLRFLFWMYCTLGIEILCAVLLIYYFRFPEPIPALPMEIWQDLFGPGIALGGASDGVCFSAQFASPGLRSMP